MEVDTCRAKPMSPNTRRTLRLLRGDDDVLDADEDDDGDDNSDSSLRLVVLGFEVLLDGGDGDDDDVSTSSLSCWCLAERARLSRPSSPSSSSNAMKMFSGCVSCRVVSCRAIQYHTQKNRERYEDIDMYLDVAVHPAALVEVAHGPHHLAEHEPRAGLGQGALAVEILEQVAALGVLHEEERVAVGLHHAVAAHDVRVVERQEQVAFEPHALEQPRAALVAGVLGDQLHGVVPVGLRVAPQVDGAARTLPDLPHQLHRTAAAAIVFVLVLAFVFVFVLFSPGPVDDAVAADLASTGQARARTFPPVVAVVVVLWWLLLLIVLLLMMVVVVGVLEGIVVWRVRRCCRGPESPRRAAGRGRGPGGVSGAGGGDGSLPAHASSSRRRYSILLLATMTKCSTAARSTYCVVCRVSCVALCVVLCRVDKREE